MSNRFLISVAAAALIAGTGFANAQGTGMGRDAGSAGSAAQQSAPSSERGGGASSGTMQRDSGRESGGASDMKSTQSEPKSKGAEKNQRAEDQMKGGKDMKAEGKEDRGGMKSEQKAEQKSEQKGQTTGQGTMQRDQSTTQRDQTQRDQTTTQGRDQPSRDQKAQGQQDRMQTQTQGGAAGQSTTTTGQAGAGSEALDRAAYPDHQRDQGDPRSAGDERELLDFGRHPRTARRELPCVAAASRNDLSGMAQVQVHPRQGADRDRRSGHLRDRGGSGILTRHVLSIRGGQHARPFFVDRNQAGRRDRPPRFR